MKKIKSCKVWKLALVFALSLSFLSVMTNSISLLANEETFGIEENVKIGEDKTYADITFNIEDLKDGYSIESIENPDGSTIDMITNPLYTVWENGTYDFIVKYRESDTSELLEVTKSVEVDGIEISDNKVSDIQPLTTITNGGVTIDIPAYDGVGWSNGEIKDLAIKVDFNGDNTTENKKVVITLPEGMRYEQIKTAGTYSTTNVDTSILSSYPGTDPLATAITKMELPTRETTGPKSTYGDLVIYFSAGTKTATIDLKVRVDGYKYYGPHTIKDPVEATLYMGSPTQELGSAEQSVATIGESSGTGLINKQSYNTATTQILVSTSEETSYGLAYGQRISLYNSSLSSVIGTDRRFVKSAVIYMYYPEGMEFDSLVTDVNWSGVNPTVVNEPESNRVKITFSSGMSLYGAWIKYKVPEDATLGYHENPASDYAEITNYDGTTYTTTISGTKYKVEVIDPSAFENKMNLTYAAAGNVDNVTLSSSKTWGPFFSLKNITAGTKTDQIFEVEIDSDWQVETIRLPFDTTVSGNELKDIEYQTSKDPGVWKTYTPANASDVGTSSTLLKQVTKYKVGMDDDEYFTALRANVGKFSSTYSLGYASNIARTHVLATYGSLKSGVTSADVTMTLYDKNDSSVKTTATGKINSSSVSGYKSSFSGSINYYDEEGTNITQLEAGNTVTVKGTMALSYVNSTSTIMKAPEIYIRQPEGMTIAIDTLVIKDQDGKVVEGWVYTTHVNDEGETIYVIKTSDTTFIGFYFEDDKTKSLSFSYDISTNVKLIGNYDGRELVAWGNSSLFPLNFADYVAVSDSYDFNGNNDTTEVLFSFGSKVIKIVENKNMLVETFLSISGEEAKDSYVEGNSNSVAYFTPGTNADYTVKLKNNSDAAATGFETYIPIPKTDENYGPLFQSEDFKWDMMLKEAVTVPLGYEVLYSTDATGTNYASAIYSTSLPANLEDVKMVKIRATASIAPGAGETIKVSLIVDEDFDSATAGDKIGKRNVYSPVYDVVSTSYTGTLSGTKVGAELVIAEVGGTIFVDKDADGLYIPENGDTPVSGHEVKLYKWDDGSDSYEPVINPSTTQQYTVTSDSNGVYLFDYTTGMGYGKYAVEFVEKTGATYQYTINNSTVGNESINSDAIIANDYPEDNDTYRGWAINIDATKPVAKTIGCGFLKYDPPVDLSVSVSTTPNQVKVGESIIVNSTVTPDFWDSIKAATGAYTWSLDDSTNITLTNNNDGTVTITPTALAAPIADKTVNLTLTITDVYGNTKTSASVPIKILSNIAPTITAADTVAYVGDAVVNYSKGLSATDVTGNSMLLIPAGGGLQNAWISESVPQADGKYTTAGSYKITYRVKDARGNETSVDRLVRVHEKPTITANSVTYLLTDSTIDTQVNGLASATWLEAPTTEGAAVSRDVTSSITKTVTSEMGVTDFSKAGLYTVTFNLNVPIGGTASKTVQVLVKDPKDESSDGLTIHAENFVLEYTDAQDLTLAKSIANGKVQGYVETEKNGEIEKIEKLNNSALSVDTTQLKAIQSATIDGGIYKLTFTATKDSKTISKEIEVLVKPKNAVVDGSESLMLDAKAFVVDYEDAASLTEALAITNGSGQGYKVERSAEGEVTAITDVTSLISVEPIELTAIQSTPEEGGVYLLTYILSDNSITLTKQVEVFVKPKGGDIEKDISLYATNLSLSYEDALNLTSADVLANTNAKATKVNKDSYGNITSFTDISSSITVDEDQIEKINNAKVSGGVFTVTLSVTDGSETKTKDIQVFVWPGKSVTVDDTTISANGFTLTTDEAKGLDLIVAKKEANASAYALTLDGSNNVISAKDISDNITVDENELKAIQKTGYNGGLYALTFTVKNGSTVATISVPVLVQQDAITNDLVIHANPFTVENAEAKSLDKDTAVNEEHANVMAYQIERDIYGNISTIQDLSAGVDIDTAELDAINATDSLGGIYPLTFSITNNGNTEETTIDVLVKPEKYITDPTGVLTLSVTGFEITEADASGFNESMALSKGNATSFKFEKDEDGNILGFNDVSNNITVNKDELKTIKESGEGIYPLTYTITDGDITVSKTIYVVVTGKNTPSIVDGLAISGKDFTLTYDEALKLDQATAIEKAGIISVLVNNDAAKARLLLDSEITLEVKGLDAINATSQKGGEYPLIFIASYTNEDGEIITNEVTVNVTVLEKGEVVINKPSIDGTNDSKVDTKDVVATSDVTDINFLLSLCGISFLLCLIIVSKRNKKET